MWAVCAGNEEVVSYLLQRDVVNRKDTVGVITISELLSGQQGVHGSSFGSHGKSGVHVQNFDKPRLESIGDPAHIVNLYSLGKG